MTYFNQSSFKTKQFYPSRFISLRQYAQISIRKSSFQKANKDLHLIPRGRMKTFALLQHRAHRTRNRTRCERRKTELRRLRREHYFNEVHRALNDSSEEEERVVRYRIPKTCFQGHQELSPEQKASKALVTLMTMAAARVVLDQWCGSRHRSPMYDRLIEYVQKEGHPIKDGTAWLNELMKHPEMDFRLAAVRILETRMILVSNDRTGFNWELMEENVRFGIAEESNELSKTYLRSLCRDDEDEGDDDEDDDSGRENDGR